MRKVAPDEQHIRAMFDDAVERYDLINNVLSMGLANVWRAQTRRALRARPRGPVLDVGCGTGALTAALEAPAVGVDVSTEMLRRARLGPAYAAGSAFRLPFRDGAFAGVTSAFVLRNLTDLEGAFAEFARVCAPGARLAIADITEPRNALIRRGFHAWFDRAAPFVGGLAGKRATYEYLVRSLVQLPPPPQVCEMLRAAGFVHARAIPLTGGMVTLFVARKEER